MDRRNKKTKKPRPAAADLGVRFELEEDAEKIFLEALERMDVHAIPESSPPQTLVPQKAGTHTDLKQAVDLHGMTVPEAKEAVDRCFVEVLSRRARTREITVITGKGRHSSAGQGVLVREIYNYVKASYIRHIDKIDTSPADLLLEGLPIRGYFRVWLKN